MGINDNPDDPLWMTEEEDKDKCNWYPWGNGNFERSCGRLVHDRKFSPTRDKVCRFCGKPFTDSTYQNVHEPIPVR